MDTIPEAPPDQKPQPTIDAEMSATRDVLAALMPLTTESRQRILRHASDYFQACDPRRGY